MNLYFFVLKMISVWDYLKYLKQNRIFTNKQIKYLSHITIYVNQLKVYKIIVFKDWNKKNGQKYGITSDQIITPNESDIMFPQLKKELEGSEKGYKMFMYYPKTEKLLCYDGEPLL